ncbi:DnaB-like helicase C-terminal domain-containing protein [Xanthomonas fragariae]|uniref:DnaB-like helicase C-terminal domain-containing protein n=1 Tax=Xanthomonas fragariae TaxID=48664 RepID=UPI003D18D806
MIVVGGRPSTGKTTFVLGLCQHVVFRRMRGATFFSLESAAKQIAARIVSSLSGVDTHALRSRRPPFLSSSRV